MKISELKTHVLYLPFPRPTRAGVGGGDFAGISPVVVRLRTDNGLEGLGYAFVFNQQHLRSLHAAVNDVAGLVMGEDPLRTQYLWQKMWSETGHLGHQGVGIYALAAIDTAIWDIAAKHFDVPLYRLLGSYRDSVPMYASGWLWRTWTIDELQRDAADLVQQGFQAMKVRVGPGKADEAVERVRAVRDVIGPDVRLMVDVNWGWNVSEAITIGRRLEEQDIYWLEDPLASDAPEQLAQVAAALDVPLCAGETHNHKFGFRRLFECGAVDIAMIDLQRVGGITEWLRVAALAQAWHLPVVSHLFWQIDVHLLAAMPNALIGEYMPWWGAMFREAPRVVNGWVELPQRPGLGLELDEKALERFAV